ncbi:MAG: glycosyltransferase family 1 protein [Saprospiraceae bacterium]|nr:glycosyltransferase family 1 protein [Saprospiraceae bacterium]
MKKIKVAFFADMLNEDFDGASRTIYQIIRRIDPKKYTFFFMCGSPPAANFPFKYYQIPSVEIPKNEDYRIAIPALDFFDMNNAMLIFNPDVIHISSPSFLGRYAVDYANDHDIPVVTIYHTHFISYIDYYFKGLKMLIDPVKSFVISRNKSFYNNCDLVLVPSQSLIEELAGYEFDRNKMKLWPRGMNLAMFSPSKKDKTLLTQIANDKPVALFVSRLVWEKNLSTLIKIYQLNEAAGHKFQFVIAGDGVAMEALESKMPNALFLGNMDHKTLSVWYATADVFLFPSDTETYGNVVVEAMASGLPVVAADAGGPSDLVDQHKTGIKCPPQDATAFYEAMLLLISDAALRNDIIHQALSFVQTLDWERLVAEYFIFIDDLVPAKNP